MDFKLTHFALMDLKWTYLFEGFKITAYTDVPCHLYCRMTQTEPLKHSLPSPRRGLRLTGDIRFCFVVYEDNEQEEPGDTLIHTFYKTGWPLCQTRWFYFVGTIAGKSVVSETAIFKLHYNLTTPPFTYSIYATADVLGKSFILSGGPTTTDWTSLRNGWNLGVNATNYLSIDSRYNGARYMAKTFVQFDLSGISPSCHFTSITLSLYGYSKFGTGWVYLLKGYHSNPMVTANWATHMAATPVLSSIHVPDIKLGDWNYLTLDVEGETWFRENCGGTLRFCFRHHSDYHDLPSEAWGSAYFWRPWSPVYDKQPLLSINDYVP
jgi:hypothetical protein